MSTRPFAYNPGGNISGTQRFGSLTVGTPVDGFESQSVKFWNGPEELDGIIIVAYPDPEATHMGADGTPAQIGFVKFDNQLTFKQWCENKTSNSFVDGAAAKTYLLANGYWTNFDEIYGSIPTATPVPNPTATPVLPTATPVPDPTSTAVPDPTATPVPNPTATPGESGSGSGSWYLYSDEGNLDAQPPLQDGNAIFLIRDNETNTITETFNLDKASGASEIYFNLRDSASTDYTAQFTDLQTKGGTISIRQGENIVTYTSTTPGAFIADTGAGFFIIFTAAATQTATSSSRFVYGDPISISFS